MMKKMKITILDGYTADPTGEAWKGLEALGTVTVYERTKPEETILRAKEAEVVLTNKVCLRREEMEQLPKLKYIGVLATGYNVVDVELTITNRTEHYTALNRKGAWTASPDFCYWDTSLTELAGKTFGIVGLGHIGQRVAAIAHAFGMKVVALTSKSAEALPPYIVKKSLDELLAESDVLSLHCPLTPDTKHLINRETLQQMKPSAILINTGRGPLVKDEDVAEALSSNRLRAFCADVLTEEPPQADHPLLDCENAFITPHIAWATAEARARLLDVAISNIRAFLEGMPKNVV